MDCFDRERPAVVNAHYFGTFLPRKKARITEFIAFGNTDTTNRRNINLIMKICEYLKNKNIKDYRIKIIGDESFAAPEEHADNVQSLGFLPFSELYNEIERVDFILALIDPASIEYTNKASGTYQLCYGFLKPILIHQKFAEIGGFTDKNSILYEDISSAVERAVSMNAGEYDEMVGHLTALEQNIYKSSLHNLQYTLEADIKNR
jgi:hypothetical protein